MSEPNWSVTIDFLANNEEHAEYIAEQLTIAAIQQIFDKDFWGVRFNKVKPIATN